MKFNQKLIVNQQIHNQRQQMHSQLLKSTKTAQKATSNASQSQKKRVIQFQEVDFEEEISESDSQVSLEEDLLEEHLTVLNQKIKNYYFQNSQNNSATLYISKASLQGFQQTLKIDTLEQYLTEIAHTFSPHPHNLLKSLLPYLEQQTGFRVFLRHIYYCFATRISMEILELVCAVWALYLPYLKMSLSLEEVQQVAILVTKRICQREKMNVNQNQYENYREGKEAISKHRLYFVIATTTIFVIEKIFKNPFFRQTKNTAESQDQVQMRQLERRRKLVKLQRKS